MSRWLSGVVLLLLLVASTPARADPALCCDGDCNGDGTVTIDELLLFVDLALNGGPTDACPPCPCFGPGDLCGLPSFAVNNALHGCLLAPTPSPTPTPPPGVCLGDCDGSGDVTVDEIITMVNMALGNVPGRACPALPLCENENCTVNEIIAAVNNALNGCVALATASPTPTTTFTTTPMQTYSVSGTVNAQVAHGRLILVYEGVFEPNVLKFRISTFDYAGLVGSGEMQYLTILNSLSIAVNVRLATGRQMQLTGTQHFVPLAGLFPVISDFTVSGGDYSITFSASPD